MVSVNKRSNRSNSPSSLLFKRYPLFTIHLTYLRSQHETTPGFRFQIWDSWVSPAGKSCRSKKCNHRAALVSSSSSWDLLLLCLLMTCCTLLFSIYILCRLYICTIFHLIVHSIILCHIPQGILQKYRRKSKKRVAQTELHCQSSSPS